MAVDVLIWCGQLKHYSVRNEDRFGNAVILVEQHSREKIEMLFFEVTNSGQLAGLIMG